MSSSSSDVPRLNGTSVKKDFPVMVVVVVVVVVAVVIVVAEDL